MPQRTRRLGARVLADIRNLHMEKAETHFKPAQAAVSNYPGSVTNEYIDIMNSCKAFLSSEYLNARLISPLPLPQPAAVLAVRLIAVTTSSDKSTPATLYSVL